LDVPIITSFFLEVILGAALVIIGAAGAVMPDGAMGFLMVLAKNAFRLPKFFTFSRRSSSILSTPKLAKDLSFGMKSTAPRSSAFSVASAPSVVSELTMITGSGFSAIIFSRAVSPSILGISMSRVTTSGFSVFTLSTASMPLLAVPMT
jgi:small-conductance mechanosensitive channel